MAFTVCLVLDPSFGIHSRKTLDSAQPCHLLKGLAHTDLAKEHFFV